MAQGEGFKHITVTAAEEEDVVIMAGLQDAAVPEGDEIAPEPAPEAAPEPVAAPETAPNPAPEPAVVPNPAPEPDPARQPQRKPAAGKGEYHETTLEDLQGQSMPLAQRIVIIAAIICIIGAVIYCVAFMR